MCSNRLIYSILITLLETITFTLELDLSGTNRKLFLIKTSGLSVLVLSIDFLFLIKLIPY